MNLELAHDLLAKQIFQRLSAEEKAMRKAERLLRDGYELDHDLQQEDKRRLLSREDISFIQPYLNSLQIPDTFKAYFVESDQILREAEEAEKKALRKRLKRQRNLLIAGGIAGIVILGLLIFSVKSYVDLTEQTFRNELTSAEQLIQAEQYEEAVKVYEKALARRLNETDRQEVNTLREKAFELSEQAQKFYAAMDAAKKSLEAEAFAQAVQHYEEAIETDFKNEEALNQKSIAERDLEIAFIRYKKRGLALYDVGEKKLACDWLEKAHKLKSDDPQVNQKRETCL